MSAVSSVTNANITGPLPPVKNPASGSGSGTPGPVGQPPADSADISRAGARGYLQLGRISHGLKTGKLNMDQAKTLVKAEVALQEQIATAKAANGGNLNILQALNAGQDLNQISKQIYDATHSGAPGVVGPPTPAPTPSATPGPGSIVNVAG